MKVLALNPGSTSTKVALFEDGMEIWSETQRYDTDVLQKFSSVSDQMEFRLAEILKSLDAHKTSLADLDAVVGRGGLLRPIESGTYEVNDPMVADLQSGKWGAHASNLGGLIALRLAGEGGKSRAFIVDPVVVDEMNPLARYSGLPEIGRRSIFHALNQKAMARRAAAELKKPYEQCRMIVAHMGGGISVGAHDMGRVVDVNNALDGDGPFTPERAGSLPAGGLVRLAFSGKYDLPRMLKMLTGQGGLVAHLGTNDLREVEKRKSQGDEKASLLFEAMAYQVAKEIGACAAVLEGAVDVIILTGGLAHSEEFTALIRDRVSFIAPVKVYPGEDEMKALADGAFRILSDEEKPKVYA